LARGEEKLEQVDEKRNKFKLESDKFFHTIIVNVRQDGV
jgi:hypothetical protein